MKFAGIVSLLVSVGAAGTAAAADPFYVGSWTFTAAAVAPWAEPQRKPDDTERAWLMGKGCRPEGAIDRGAAAVCLYQASVQGDGFMART